MKVLIALAALVAVSTQFEFKPNLKYVTQDEFIYFTDESTLMRNWVDANAFCRSEGAEIAKVKNLVIYNQIRLSFPNAQYWIDGTDPDTPSRFQLGSDCSSPDGLDFTGIPVMLSRSCLSLVRGSTANASRIQAAACSSPLKVICGYPRSGCLPGGTTPTPPTPPPTEAPTPPPGAIAK